MNDHPFVIVSFDFDSGSDIFGPFESEDEAASWAVNALDEQPNWFMVELQAPYTNEEESGLVVLHNGDIEKALDAIKEKKERERLPKEVMFDLSEIHESV